jgi:hypothetical protein
MPNIRQKEVAFEILELLKRFIATAQENAKDSHKSPYDIELSVNRILTSHMTYRCVVTEETANRHLENLFQRNLIIGVNGSQKTVKLNREFIDCTVDFLGYMWKMPEDKPL